MKKTKLISTLSAIATLGVVTPILSSVTSCNKQIGLTHEDRLFLGEINTVVATLDFEGVPFKAVHAVKNAGFNLFEHKFSNQQFELVLNMDGVKEFAILYNNQLLTNDKTVTNFDANKVWKFVDKYDSTSPFAQYLNDHFQFDSNEPLKVTGSLDTGTNTNVKQIKYVGTTSKKETYLRTYTEFLTIAPKAEDTIHHFHYANNVYVSGVGTSHYLEYGKSCYLQAQNTQLSFQLTKARDEPCSVDVFEPIGDKTVTIIDQPDQAKVYTKIGTGTTQGKELVLQNSTITQTAKTMTELKQRVTQNCIVRLESDIVLETEDVVTIGAAGSTINIVLDLNGHSIDSSKVTSSSTPMIKVTNGTLILMDSAGPDSTAEITGTQHITVSSERQTELARLILNSGKIHFVTDTNAPIPGITIGDKNFTPSSALEYRSEFYMYGGSINCKNMNESLDCSAPCVELINMSSYMYSVYGDIYGSDGAIACGDIGTTGSTAPTVDSQLEIFGGNFSCDENHICINLRRKSKLTVYGGSFTGGTCIGAMNSELILNGGVYNAIGDFKTSFYVQETSTRNGYLTAEGSVIACMWQTDQALPTATAQPSIISNNVQMYSSKSHILHIDTQDALTPTTKTWIEFLSGCYYYCGAVQKPICPAGIMFYYGQDEKFEWVQKGLWTARP